MKSIFIHYTNNYQYLDKIEEIDRPMKKIEKTTTTRGSTLRKENAMFNFAGLFIRELKENYSDDQVHHALKMVDQAYEKQLGALLAGSGEDCVNIKRVPEPLRQMLQDEIIAFMDVFREFAGIESRGNDQKEVKDYNIIKAYQKMVQTD